MSDKNKVIKMVIFITIICFVIILVAAIALKRTNGIFNKDANTAKSASQITDENKFPESDTTKTSKVSVKYETETYETKNDEGKVVCHSERNIPIVSNPAYMRGAKRIENTLKGTMNDLWNNDLKRFSDDAKNIELENGPVGVKYMANLEYQTDEIVTFSLIIDGDFGTTAMGAHELYTFDIKTGENLSLESSSNNSSELINNIIVLTKEAIKERGIHITVHDNETEDMVITSNMSRQGHFGILADGIHVNYQKYDITKESDQVIGVTLEKNKSNSLLKDEYKIK